MTDEQTILTGAGENTGAGESSEAGEKTGAGESAEAGEKTGAGESAEAGEKTGAGESAEKATAPEAYADFTFPEGFTSDTDQVKAFSTVALKAGLSQVQAQELLNVSSQGTQEIAKTQMTAWDAAVAKWHDDTKADPELGGENFKNTIETANKAMNEIATPELHELFTSLRIGNHPEIARVFVKVGVLIDRLKAATGEDTLDLGRTSIETERDPAKILYGDMN